MFHIFIYIKFILYQEVITNFKLKLNYLFNKKHIPI